MNFWGFFVAYCFSRGSLELQNVSVKGNFWSDLQSAVQLTQQQTALNWKTKNLFAQFQKAGV